MHEHHAGGALVDVLASVSAGTNKALFQVTLGNAQFGHPASQLVFLVGADLKIHARKLPFQSNRRKVPPWPARRMSASTFPHLSPILTTCDGGWRKYDISSL